MQDAATTLALKFRYLAIVHGTIGRAEVNSPFCYLFDTTARADRLIVDLHVGLHFVVVAKPLRINRIRECRARPVQKHLGRAWEKRESGDDQTPYRRQAV